MSIDKRKQTELFIPLVLSWIVYSFAQKDFLLPAAALLVTLPSYGHLWVSSKKREKARLRMAARNMIYGALLAGWFWRTFVPPPPEAVAFIPVFVSALQSACLILSVLIWFSWDFPFRAHYLKFLPWLTVALSINVPFSPLVQLSFWLFCVVSIAVIMLPAYIPYSREARQKRKQSLRKSLLFYAYPFFLFIISSAVFVVLVSGIKIGDDLFMDLIMDYARMKRHFRFFDSKLLLAGSGISRSDVRPIMEVEKKDFASTYLAGQVFERYQDGLWQASFDLPRRHLSGTASSGAKRLRITMFEYLNEIIPAPRGVVAVKAKSENYMIDANGIVSNTDKNIPRAVLLIDESTRIKPYTEFDTRASLAISPLLKTHLSDALNKVVGPSPDPYRAARQIQGFFRQHFTYDLYVNYKADDRGILYMIYRRKPAYCSYFATAMIAMLRAQGIPARMVTGFWANEVSAWDSERYIVRGRDAHAWVEALLPVKDPVTSDEARDSQGNALYRWVRFDPTPAASREDALRQDKRVNKIADWIWCAQKRLRAAILNLETQTLVRLLFLLIIFLILQEAVKYLIKQWRFKRKYQQVREKVEGDPRRQELRQAYQRFEAYLQDHYGIRREPWETDTELLRRLRETQGIPAEVIAATETFLTGYHAARFGGKSLKTDGAFFAKGARDQQGKRSRPEGF